MERAIVKQNNGLDVFANPPKTRDESIAAFQSNPLVYFNTLQPRAFKDCWDAKNVGLAGLSKHTNPKLVESIIGVAISKVCTFLNMPNVLTSEQIDFVAQVIREQYYYLNLADVKLCLRWALMGRYGKLYGKIDVTDVLQWFERYTDDRASMGNEQSYAEHVQNTADYGVRGKNLYECLKEKGIDITKHKK
jgi:hypothetical protein